LVTPDYLAPRDATLRWRFPSREGRNSLGLRNREVARKESGTYRVLFLGDSLIWTGQTSSGALYTEVVERRLNARPAQPSRRLEIINAGIPGYTTYQELEFLRVYGLDMEPDLVVLGFVFNDLHYKYLHKPTDRGLLDTDPAAHLHRLDPHGVAGTLFARSYVAHEAVRRGRRYWKTLRGRPVFPFEERTDMYLAWTDHAWAPTRQLLHEMRRVLAQHDASLRLLVFPLSDQFNQRYVDADGAFVLYPQRKIREICASEGIEMLDLTDAIRAAGGLDLYKDYLHLNGRGNDLVADEVESYLAAALDR